MAAKLEGEAYLSSFVDAISKKLSSLLEHDSVLQGNDSDLKLLRVLDDCLCDIEPVLLDAELKQFRNERVKKWLVDLQDALYLADDFLDELSTKAATRTDQGESHDWSCAVDLIIDDCGVKAIEEIVGTLVYVVQQKGKLGLEKIAKLEISSWRIPSTSLVVSSDIFGRSKDKDNVIKLLLDDICDAESRVTVIPIVGMGGIGKTTLAQLVYNDANVMGKFDTRAWVCVAESPNPINVTKTIIGAIDSSPCNMDHFDSLQTNLKQKLSGKTFLVVLDDVWNDEQDTWEEFLKPFRYGNNGSKILLTTRSEKVASVFAANNLHYQLSLLSEEDCWSVFLKHSSISTDTREYATLEPIGRKIVEKCKGLPLALKTLGGLLRNKDNVGDWENILESEIWELSEDESKIVPALRVSYHYLPSHLKRCFVYCSLYPEDYQFDKGELILLWMAEDLLQSKKNNTLENIGGAYFDELVARSFFQRSSNNENLFVMHDLIHDLATFLAGKFYFKLQKIGNLHMIDNKARHLSFHAKCEDSIEIFREASNRAAHTRTMLNLQHYCESVDVKRNPELLGQHVRVLSFPIKSLPDSIGEWISLRYLNLSGTLIATLPESICKLYNLQTLKLRNCYKLKMLPSCMQDLVNLRHLDIRGVSRLKEMPKKMSRLKHLNFFSDYMVGKGDENGIRELETLDNLHGSFCISKLENIKNSREASEAKMGNKKHINSLKLEWSSDDDIEDPQIETDILDELEPHENLKELSISGYRGETFPDWLGLSCYSNMTELNLKRCKNCYELQSLGQLPSLEILKIMSMCCWREWYCPQELDGFPRLRILEIINCPALRGDLPAYLPALEELTIANCEELTCSLPKAPQLQQLYVVGTLMGSMRLYYQHPQNYAHALQYSVIISETQLAESVLEWLPRIQPSRPAISTSVQHKSLTEILVQRCDSLILFPLGDLPNLKSLTISKCQNMECVVVSRALPSLRYLSISDCLSLLSLPALGLAAPHLQELCICNCPKVSCFAEESLSPSLKKLQVKQCQKLERWITSKGLQSQGLTHLILEEWNEVKSFPTEACLPASLQSLKLFNFSNMETLDCKGLHHLTSLKDLYIRKCEKLENITEENLPASVSNIYIGEECPLSRKLEPMQYPWIQFNPYQQMAYPYTYAYPSTPYYCTTSIEENPNACSVQ
ncbi:hypothetical protein PIB30_072879 [Stylosanthes scabra]|uniref:Disease resistance RPP13-like protein 1 n=1 Tax=Stylosanthes scabra TaxID=79078 RepID=A0ABU6VSK3_9FABA|nr:hypothetical protein [Stylosanthes scabra]